MARVRVGLRCILSAVVLVGVGCGDVTRLPPMADTGPTPMLPPPRTSLIPTVAVSPAIGWSDGAAPTPAAGLGVNAFATGLDHPRWVYVLPNGDVLVAETNAPPRPKDATGLKGRIMRQVQKVTGAATPSANRITLLRDADEHHGEKNPAQADADASHPSSP